MSRVRGRRAAFRGLAVALATGVAAAGVAATLAPACTQDFDQFVVVGSSSTTGGGVAAGGADGGGGHGAGGRGGNGGSGGVGGSSVPCGERPEPPGGTCPDVCDRCEEGVCIFDCVGVNACLLDDLVCPSGFACRVTCSSISSCSYATVTCPDDYACDTSCGATNACAGLELRCASGSCSMECDVANACTGATLECGEGACEATCGGGFQAPSVVCGEACSCSPCT